MAAQSTAAPGPIEHGWLKGARRLPSPNHNARPDEADISLLVVHNISLPPGEFGTGCIEQLFTNCLDCDAHPYFAQLRGLQVSAHVLIARDGSLTQFVPFQRRAWHAGASSFAGRDNCNDYAIGIELEGVDDAPYTPVQYQRLAGIAATLMAAYPALNAERIVGHEQIAPGRKTDPGPAFDWRAFFADLQEALT